ncbi:MAG: AraC family transcriptional regulator [Anaerocolumna sp.]
MQKYSPGVLPGSDIFFHNPSQEAKDTFFYPLCIGQFFCDHTYKVSRNSYESFLILYVMKGEGSIAIEGTVFHVKQGQTAIVDCYKKHSYQTPTGWDILWIHIDGPVCRSYYNLIVKEYGNVITLTDKIVLRNFSSILSYLFHCFVYGEFCSDVVLSKYISDLLTVLLAPPSSRIETPGSASPISQSLSYIHNHFTEQITIDILSGQVALSPYHFIRLFKKETGQTPHQYIMQMRIHSSKFYLRTTSSTIQNIAYNCGFKSENNFCICFKNNVHLTPSEYRSLESLYLLTPQSYCPKHPL